MYVCLCNGYTEKDIAQTARLTGAADADSVYQSLGADFCCGNCRDCAQQLIDDINPGAGLALMAAE